MPHSRFRRGVDLLNRRRFSAARRELARVAASADAEAAWACQELVQSFIRRRDPDGADAFLRTLFPAGAPLLAHGLGYLARRTGWPQEALACFEDARSRGLGGTGKVAARRRAPWAVDNELGFLLCRLGRAREGRRLLRGAAEHFRRTRDPWGEAIALTLLGTDALFRVRIDEALAWFGRARPLKLACGDRFGLVNVLHNTGMAHVYRGEYTLAAESYQAALAELRRLGDRSQSVFALNGIGLCHLDLAEPERAAASFRAATALARKTKDAESEAAARANLGFVSRLSGDLPRAERHYRESLRLLAGRDPDLRGTTLANLAEALTRGGREEQALAVLRGPLAPGGAVNARTRILLAREAGRALLARGELAAARAALEQALDAFGATPGSLPVQEAERLETQVLLGRVRLAAGDRAAARRLLRRAAARLEALLGRQRGAAARIGLLEASREVHDALVACLLAGSRPDRAGAWAAAASLKARELAALERTPRDAPAGGWSRLAELEQRYRRLLTLPRPTLRTARELLAVRRRYLEESDRSARSARRRETRVAPSARALTALLGSGTALLEYHVGEERTTVFVLHAGRVGAFEVAVGERRLTRAVARLLGPLRRAGSSSDARPWLETYEPLRAARLGRRLLAPALRQLPGEVRRLVVVPDGPLHALPFELLTAPSSGQAADCGPIVSYARSSRALRGGREHASRGLFALSFSPSRDVPLRTGDGWLRVGPLAGARRELDSIRTAFVRPRLRVGGGATVGAYVRGAGRASVIHLAAHAVADVRLPGLSGLFVAPAGRAGTRLDLLTADRIRSVPLRAELVVLSGCDTGQGRLRGREGVIGLARSFLAAGAAAVLASVWRVDDGATHALMAAFYRELASGAERAEALHAAKRALRSSRDGRWAHPFFWAGFVLVDHEARAGRAGKPAGVRGNWPA